MVKFVKFLMKICRMKSLIDQYYNINNRLSNPVMIIEKL